MVRMEEFSREAAAAMVRRCFHDLARQVEMASAFVPSTNLPQMEISEQRELSAERIDALRDQILSKQFDRTVQYAVEALLAGSPFAATCDHVLRQDLNEGVTRAMIEEQRLFLHRLEDRLTSYVPEDVLFAAKSHSDTLSEPASRVRVDVKGPTVGHTIELYLEAGERKWQGKTLAARRWQLRYLEECLGSETPLASITSHDIRRFRDQALSLRANHGRTARQSFKQKQTDNSSKRIAPKTAALIFEPCKAMFRWAKSDEGMIASNPAEDVRMQLEKSSKGQKARRPFTSSELEILFSSPIFTGSKSRDRRYEPGPKVYKDAKFWIPILALYGGQRLGELVQLHVADVHLDGTVPYISINEENSASRSPSERKHVKSDAGVRKVPLHPDVIALGFAEFVAGRRRTSGRNPRLFPEFPYGSDGLASTVASKWFARAMDKVGLPDPALVFHSFRHLAEDAFRDALIPQYVIDRVIGHSDGSTSAAYGQGVSLEVMGDAVKSMKLRIRLPDLLGSEISTDSEQVG